jgi:ribosomal protein L40E
MYNSLTPNGYNIAIPCEEGQSTFLKYTYNDLLNIIEDIKNTDVSFLNIAQKYGLDLSMVYYLNRGDYHTLPNEIYPLRLIKSTKKKDWYCVDCGAQISKGATRCSQCDHKRQQKVDRPLREELKQMIYTKSFTAIGAQYGVSDNSVRKWCQNYNLPTRKKEIKSFTPEEWDRI